MIIATLIFLRLYHNDSKNIDILFLVMGTVTCFFDFLTAETLTLSIPLICYTFLEIKKNNSASFKKILSFFILWGIGYSLMWFTKWSIDLLYYGPQYAGTLFNYIFNNPAHTYTSISYWSILVRNASPWLPFGLTQEGTFIFIFLICIILFFNLIRNRKYLPLIIVSMIPLARYMLIQGHSYGLFFMTYRAALSFIVVIILTTLIMIRDFLVVDPVVHPRRRNVKGSKGKSVL